MSDPVTTAEVEDVLSSIRRLVSEEKRPQQAEVAAPAPQTDRLVLTPALRVADVPARPDTMAQDIEAAFTTTQVEETENKEDLSASDWTLEDANTLDHAADKAITTGWADEQSAYDEPDDSHDDPFDHPSDDPVETRRMEHPADIDLEAEDTPYSATPEAEAEHAPRANPLPTLTLEPEARSDAQWVADARAEAQDVADTTQFSPENTSVAETKAATLSAKIEALESAIGGIEDDFEPDEISDDAYSGTHAPALQWEDDLQDAGPESVTEIVKEDFATDLVHDAIDELAAETPRDITRDVEDDIAGDTIQQLQDPIQETVFAAAAAAAAGADRGNGPALEMAEEEKLLDEDALRDMVGEIVRSELQGALGERITRNVRKLVRREIHRALTTQDLD